MGSFFSVKQERLSKESLRFCEYGRQIKGISSGVENVRQRLWEMQGSMKVLSRQTAVSIQTLYSLAETAKLMGNALGKAASQYVSTEKSILQNGTNTENRHEETSQETADKFVDDGSWWSEFRKFIHWGTPVEEDEIDSVVFDDEGDYGGDQGDPQSQWGFWSEKEDLYEIVKEHYPDYSDKEIAVLLKRLNSEGCSYVSFLNALFAAYEGREGEFEQTFGFPMYKDGDLNYNELLVDYYCSTDNHIPGNDGDMIDSFEDYSSERDGEKSGYDIKKDTSGSGANPEEVIYRAQRYLDDKGVEANIVTRTDITTENFQEFAEDGYVVINYYDGPIQDINGDTVQFIDGGHAMTITGVTSDGRYIVSSWGEKYYLDPDQGDMCYTYIQFE